MAFLLLLLAVAIFSSAQTLPVRTPLAITAPTPVPGLIPFSGVATGVDGKPLQGPLAITFLLFRDETGGDPLWAETQAVQPDSTGKVQRGSGRDTDFGHPAGSVFPGRCALG
jgi:hypothetical protein